MSQHDTKELRIQILGLVKERLGPRICPGCATEAMVGVLADFMNCAIQMQDRPLLDATAAALEDIAGHCRQMTPITGVVLAGTRTH